MTATDYGRVKPFELTWRTYKTDGTATLSHEDKKILESVYININNSGPMNLYCNSCVAEMFSNVMIAFEKVTPDPIPGEPKKRQRI